jgi:hypothetical protein
MHSEGRKTMGTKHILMPLMTFILEGMPFFNVTATGSIWYQLLFFNFPIVDLTYLGLPTILTALLYLAEAIVFWPIWVGVIIIKIVGLIGILVSIMSIPFSAMVAFPILVIPQTILVLIFAYGIITSIHIAGSGVEPKE